jgi:peptidoglycan/LPS O-acetylase OafA/YrhL
VCCLQASIWDKPLVRRADEGFHLENSAVRFRFALPTEFPLSVQDETLKKSSQILGINRLRGLAALVVVLMHCVMILPVDLSAAPFIGSGYYGVSLFFAISGFLITTNILRRYGAVGAVNVSDFYVMRAARILPSLTLLIVLLSALAIFRYPGFVFEEGHSSLGKAIWSVLTLSFNKSGIADPLGWVVLWSLSIEEAFYVLYPVIAIVLRKEKALIGVLLLVIAYGISGRTTRDSLYTYRGCFDLIAMGALAAIAAHRLKAPQWSLVWAKWLGAVITLTAYFFVPLEHVTVGPSLIALGGVMMLYTLKVEEGRAARPRRVSLLGTIGECSYELYLFHYSVFVLVAPGLTGIFGAGSYINVAIALIMAFCVSLAVHRYFSDPLNARIRELFVRRTPTATSRPTIEVLGPPVAGATRQ